MLDYKIKGYTFGLDDNICYLYAQFIRVNLTLSRFNELVKYINKMVNYKKVNRILYIL